MPTPRVSVVIPTRGRAASLDAALRTIAPQVAAADGEVVIVEDGPGDAAAVAARHGARRVALEEARGPNAARNAGIAAARAPLVVLTEDDVEAPDGWLAALLRAAEAQPDVEVFGGPIRGRIDAPWRQCGREWPPVSSLDRGPADRDVVLVYAGNMLLRRSALERVGPFAESLGLYPDEAARVATAASGSAPGAGFYGDEEEWQERHRAAGGRIRYVAAARVDHVRRGKEARLAALVRAAHARGRVARRWAASHGEAPGVAAEAQVLAGAVAHGLRYRCSNGWLWAATAAGRLREAVAGAKQGGVARDAPPYLAPGSGLVLGRRARAVATVRDALLDLDGLRRRPPVAGPSRRVLVLGVERTDVPGLMAAARRELEGSRHDVDVRTAAAGAAGKFENLNALLAGADLAAYDWLLVVDDDVALPRRFLDRFLAVAERCDFALAQPAHRHRSHAAWPITRRRAAVARETRFVEIGPVTAFRADTFDTFLPFPALRMGWGLDAHWAAVARVKGWRIGIVDAAPVLHGLRRTGSGYAHSEAAAEAAEFLRDRPYVTREEAAVPIRVHRR